MQLQMNQTRTRMALLLGFVFVAAAFAGVYFFASPRLAAQGEQFVHC